MDVPLDDDEAGAPTDGLVQEAVAVDFQAGYGDEKAPRGALPGVVTEASHVPGKVPRDLPYIHPLKHIGKAHPSTFTGPC
jgi:hypothetical protein